MDVQKILETARSALSAERVYGAPVERDGVTVVPAAKLSGGGGGGGDEHEHGGGGGGFGVHGRPAGALVIGRDGKVRWKPTIDVNRVILGGQMVAIAFLVTGWLTQRSKARAAMKATIAVATLDRLGRGRS